MLTSTRGAIHFIAILLISYRLVDAGIVLTNVERNIDISSQLARTTSKIVATNEGATSVDNVVVGIDSASASKVAFLDATLPQEDEDDEKVHLTLTETTIPEDSTKASYYTVKLQSPLGTGQSVAFLFTAIMSHSLTPHPSNIAQSEKQLVIFKDSHYMFSPYLVKKQTTTVKLSSATIESFSKLKPSSSSESTITYGPYKEIAAFKNSEMKVHYENNSPFLTVNEMTRWIEVSHWGNVAVEETYSMTHTGAGLKGHFSRYDYQRTPTYSAIKSFKTVLPASARDVYYRDVIGNISTSNMAIKDDSVEVELKPRFPLFGGWQTQYYMGYNLPSFEYLFNKGSKYVLKMRVVDYIYDDFVVDKLTVKVALPEGAKNVELHAPFDVTEGARELHKTYLDTTGRTVVVLNKNNVVENHIQDFQIHYTFEKYNLLQEPLLCIIAFYVMFVSVIFIVRLDFSITKVSEEESEKEE